MASGTLALSGAASLAAYAAPEHPTPVPEKYPALKGNIHHTACRWCYQSVPLDELCAFAKKIGLVGIDLVAPQEWPTLQQHGLIATMCYHAGKVSLTEGFNHKEFHPQLIKDYTEAIPLVGKAGYKNIICFSGSRNGMDDETGLQNCVEGLQQILPLAEKHGVVVQMELLNSKVDHKDYMCDKTPWGVELCKRLNTPHFKLLYDIYHMQIDEGDVIRTIRDNFDYLGHFHTGGVPGRHIIDDSQELFYPAIMKAIIDLGYQGYVAQEFIPTAKENDQKLAQLQKGVMICDV